MVRLVPMSQTQFDSYVDTMLREYAQSHVDAGNWTTEEALEMARESTRRLLPEGLTTENQYLLSIEDGALGEKVGVLWFAVEDHEGGPRAFVYDVEIDEAYRRRGYATQAFEALEARVRDLGLPRIMLHVFGHNRPARALYAKLGFEEVDLILSKTVL